jgi:SAM-dependent methyltransferase
VTSLPAAPEAWEGTPPPREFVERGVAAIRRVAVPACPVCGGLQFAPLGVGFDYELLTCSNPWRIVRCVACGHGWLNPRPDASELGVIYPPDYYAYDYESRINPVAVRGKELLDGLKFRGILARLGRTPRAYLDVGCGAGRYLRLLERRGVPRRGLFGLELDRAVVDRLRAEGYSVFAERVEDATSLPEGGFDLVTMFHVLEHVAEPAAVVERVARWLAPDGVFAVETPNLDSLDARLFRERFWGGYHIPRHFQLFTLASLTRLLAAHGLEVESVRYQTGHSFWMYSLHHRLRYGDPPRPRLARWFDPFRGLPFLAAFTAWDRARAALGSHTSAMLLIVRRRGRIGGRG